MKLLELTRLYYPSIGGMERFVYERTKIYERLDIEYNVLSTTLRTEKKDYSIPVKNVSYLRQFTPYNIVPALPFVFSNKYDIISVNSIGRFYSDYAVFHYSKRNKIIILTPYFAFHSSRYSFLKRIVEKYLFPNILRRVDAIIVFSNIEKSHWIDHYNVNPEKIFVIPPYINIEEEYADYHSTGEKYLLYLGRAEINKKTDLLLETFLKSPNIPLTLKLTLSRQDLNEELLSRILKDKRIQLLGVVTEKEKNELLSRCEALVFPTSWESFGYVAFEASKFKKPLLCSDIPVLKELLHPEGVIYFKNSVEELTDAIRRFSSLSNEKKNEMGELNFQNLMKFSFDPVCNQYENMFKAISKHKA